jgi:hypothetical protein
MNRKPVVLSNDGEIAIAGCDGDDLHLVFSRKDFLDVNSDAFLDVFFYVGRDAKEAVAHIGQYKENLREQSRDIFRSWGWVEKSDGTWGDPEKGVAQ